MSDERMGLLQSLFGDSSPPDSHQQKPEPSIDLPEEEYEPVFPVHVRQSELLAFKQAINADRGTPHIDGAGSQMIQEITDSVWRDYDPDDMSLSEKFEENRQRAERVIGAWETEIQADQGVVLLPVGIYFELHQFLVVCESRAENEEDPFELPDNFLEAAQLVKRLKEADRGDAAPSVLAHVDDIPVLPTAMKHPS